MEKRTGIGRGEAVKIPHPAVDEGVISCSRFGFFNSFILPGACLSIFLVLLSRALPFSALLWFPPPSPFLMYWSTTENGVVTSDSLKFLFCFSMYISRRALKKQFDPRQYPVETYLLCELRWNGNERSWIHWIRNDVSHVEAYFLQEVFEPRSYGSCDITWYLSWSPCWSCCNKIQDFLKRHPNVNINIHVARVYYSEFEQNQRGLRELHEAQRVTIRVMEEEGKVSHALWDWGGVSWWTLCMGESDTGLLLWYLMSHSASLGAKPTPCSEWEWHPQKQMFK